MFPQRPEHKFCPLCSSALEDHFSNGRNRRKCSNPECKYVFWDNPTPVVAAIVEHEGKIVLVQGIGWPEKWYGLVTGFLEAGETPEEGLLREVKEEIGLDAEIVEWVGHYSFMEMNQIIFCWHVRAEGTIQLDETELQAYKHIEIDKVQPWPLGTGVALKDWLERRKKRMHP